MNTKQITYKEYMANSSELFHDYHAQFVTQHTRDFVERNFPIEKLLASSDGHLNDLCSHSHGGAGKWTWDFSPINLPLARELGGVAPNGLGSDAFHTCVGKAAARQLMAEHKEAN